MTWHERMMVFLIGFTLGALMIWGFSVIPMRTELSRLQRMEQMFQFGIDKQCFRKWERARDMAFERATPKK